MVDRRIVLRHCKSFQWHSHSRAVDTVRFGQVLSVYVESNSTSHNNIYNIYHSLNAIHCQLQNWWRCNVQSGNLSEILTLRLRALLSSLDIFFVELTSVKGNRKTENTEPSNKRRKLKDFNIKTHAKLWAKWRNTKSKKVKRNRRTIVFLFFM